MATSAPAGRDDNTSAIASLAAPSSSPLLQLPTELLRSIVLVQPHFAAACKDSLAYSLYQTCRAAQTSMRPWIGETSITLAEADDRAEDALEQLRGFPRMSTLRKLRLHLRHMNEEAIAHFLSSQEASKLATVMHLDLHSKEALSLSVAMNIASACPSLQTLEYVTSQSFTWIKGLLRLNCLQKLHVQSAPSFLDPRDAEALGSLVSLQSLELPVNNLEALLPRLSSLASLTELTLVSDRAALSADVPEFSSLAALSALHKLKWVSRGPVWYMDGTILSSSTLSAICSCSSLVSLDISWHLVVGAVGVKLLLEMPCLEILKVASLQPDVPVSVSRCSLKTLVLTASDEDCKFLTRLPAEFLQLQELKLFQWCLGAGDSAEAVAAFARDVRAAAQFLSVVWRDVNYRTLRLAWRQEPPALPTACVLTGLSTLDLDCLMLKNWAVDKALALQLAEAAPSLDSLTLNGCSISSCGWVGLQALTALSELFLDLRSPLKEGPLTAFAVGWPGGQDLMIYIQEETMDAEGVRECEQVIQAMRQARGMACNVALDIY